MPPGIGSPLAEQAPQSLGGGKPPHSGALNDVRHPSGVAGAFNKAPTIELIAQVLVKSVGLRSTVAAGDFKADTTVRPAEFLDCGHEQPADSALTMAGVDDETRDAPQGTVGMKERDAMKGNDANHALRQLRHENHRVDGSRTIRDSSLDVLDG